MLNLIKLMVVVALSTFSVNALAIPLATVGTQDTLLASDTLKNSGFKTERDWIQDVLGVSIDYTQLSGSVSDGSNWEAVDSGVAGDYAFKFDIGFNTAYYLLKVGGGNGTGTEETHYLYNNLDSLQYAFINLSDFGANVKLDNIGVISHGGHTGGGGTNVPEPGIVGLLAIGLLGMVARRKLKA